MQAFVQEITDCVALFSESLGLKFEHPLEHYKIFTVYTRNLDVILPYNVYLLVKDGKRSHRIPGMSGTISLRHQEEERPKKESEFTPNPL